MGGTPEALRSPPAHGFWGIRCLLSSIAVPEFIWLMSDNIMYALALASG